MIRNWRGKEIGKSDSTTPVTQYEGKGNRPFGVVDMVGNVWERCLTVYEIGKIDLSGADACLFRGGSCKQQELDIFRTFNHDRDIPYYRSNDVGFGIARLP